MKAVIFACFVLFASSAIADGIECKQPKVAIPDGWNDIKNGISCVQAMRGQIQEELNAAMQYLAMGSHFSKYTINRPGFAKLFFDSASEERQHGMKLISYLLMRGELTKDVSTLLKLSVTPKPTKWTVGVADLEKAIKNSEKIKANDVDWFSGVAALKNALELENTVTKSIRNVISTCENSEGFNDYHLVDYLTGVYLEEQYHGMRDLAGKLSTLQKMTDKHGTLGEFLFDKKLLA